MIFSLFRCPFCKWYSSRIKIFLGIYPEEERRQTRSKLKFQRTKKSAYLRVDFQRFQNKAKAKHAWQHVRAGDSQVPIYTYWYKLCVYTPTNEHEYEKERIVDDSMCRRCVCLVICLWALWPMRTAWRQLGGTMIYAAIVFPRPVCFARQLSPSTSPLSLFLYTPLFTPYFPSPLQHSSFGTSRLWRFCRGALMRSSDTRAPLQIRGETNDILCCPSLLPSTLLRLLSIELSYQDSYSSLS